VLNYLSKSRCNTRCFSERVRAGTLRRRQRGSLWSLPDDALFPGSVCKEEGAWVLILCAAAAKGRRGLGKGEEKSQAWW